MEGTRAARQMGADRAALSRRPHGRLVGLGGDRATLWTRHDASSRRCNHRSAALTSVDDVVPTDESAGTRQSASSNKPAGSSQFGRDCAVVWAENVGGAELQAGEAGAGLGGVSSAE